MSFLNLKSVKLCVWASHGINMSFLNYSLSFVNIITLAAVSFIMRGHFFNCFQHKIVCLISDSQCSTHVTIIQQTWIIYMFLSPIEELSDTELFWGQRPIQARFLPYCIYKLHKFLLHPYSSWHFSAYFVTAYGIPRCFMIFPIEHYFQKLLLNRNL